MINNIAAYILKTLGMQATLVPYGGAEALPYLLQGNYTFFVATVSTQKFLLMYDRQTIHLTPLAIRKHCDLVREHWNGQVVYAAAKMSSYDRTRLVKQQVPFIIPERQLYLPFLGMVFSESENKSGKEFSELGVLSQLLVLGILNKQITEPLTIKQASAYFGYSQMSISRAFDELEYFALARREVQKSTKTKHLIFSAHGKALWEQALPLMKTPLRRVVGIETIPDGLPVYLAGINALAQKTMLSESSQIEYATTAKAYNALKNIETIPKASAPVLLQLWIYSPTFPGNNMIDSLSLYLSLKDDADERVQIALDELLKGVQW
ncbi:MAG: hypothetical protein PHH77_09110 [Victivallaceae bacterium]|nr:hypothetical protein [Victivallaceae bacterium]